MPPKPKKTSKERARQPKAGVASDTEGSAGRMVDSSMGQAEDYIWTLPNGIKVRVRLMPFDVSATLIVDFCPGMWVIKPPGFTAYYEAIGRLMDAQPWDAWCQAAPTGLWGRITKEAVPVFLGVIEALLSDPALTSWFTHDASLMRGGGAERPDGLGEASTKRTAIPGPDE